MDGRGVPLSIVVDGADRHDVKLLEQTLDSVVMERRVFLTHLLFMVDGQRHPGNFICLIRMLSFVESKIYYHGYLIAR